MISYTYLAICIHSYTYIWKRRGTTTLLKSRSLSNTVQYCNVNVKNLSRPKINELHMGDIKSVLWHKYIFSIFHYIISILFGGSRAEFKSYILLHILGGPDYVVSSILSIINPILLQSYWPRGHQHCIATRSSDYYN